MCDCIEIVNAKLRAAKQCVLDLPFFLPMASEDPLPPAKVVIKTKRVDGNKRKPTVTLAATFCPFCGEKY